MTKQEVLAALRPLNREQQLQWTISLGGELTVAARASYPVEHEAESISHLIAFNEMQHQVYSRIRHLQAGDAWELEGFIDRLQERAVHHGVEGDFGGALKTSIQRLQK